MWREVESTTALMNDYRPGWRRACPDILCVRLCSQMGEYM